MGVAGATPAAAALRAPRQHLHAGGGVPGRDLRVCPGLGLPPHHGPRLRQCWLRAARHYPNAQKIYVVVDHWPVHFHPDALDALAQDPRLELLALPTYAPWLNPIEKLWRLVRQRVTHAHPWSDDFPHFRRQVRTHLRAFEQDAPGLLRYVGLLPQ